MFGLTLAGESLAAHRLPALAAILVSAVLLGTAIVLAGAAAALVGTALSGRVVSCVAVG